MKYLKKLSAFFLCLALMTALGAGTAFAKTDEDESDDDVKEISLNVKKVSRTNSRSSLGGIQNNDYDVEDLKRQILKK